MALVHIPSTPWTHLGSWDRCLPPHLICFLECSGQRPYHRQLCILRALVVLQCVSLINGQSQTEVIQNSSMGTPQDSACIPIPPEPPHQLEEHASAKRGFWKRVGVHLEASVSYHECSPPPMYRGVVCHPLHLWSTEGTFRGSLGGFGHWRLRSDPPTWEPVPADRGTSVVFMEADFGGNCCTGITPPLSAPGPRMLRGPDVVGHGTPRLRGCGAQGESACNESVGTMRIRKDTSGGKSTWLTC